ncbi:hypothetical protein BJV74DRAFT_797603 [Russula compacta]|nr:hypothetical protein BJV74DRAFT_797603 [Russula compacta]
MFLPRSLTNKHHRPIQQRQPQPPPATLTECAATPETTADDHHPAILCALAFSDHQLWFDPSLRDPNRDGFVPIRTLLHTSPVFLAANVVSLTETAIVKSLRAHARDTFDIRMIVVDKTRNRHGRHAHGHTLAGGYEIRRKDWAEATERFPTFSSEYWDTQTIYIGPRTTQQLPRYTTHFSPPHHQDPPDAIPKCKGFALVTLSDPSAISHLLTHFPYHNSSAPAAADENNDDASPEELEARKAGFRTLSKERWEALQSEYVEYRDALLRHVAASSSTSTSTFSATTSASAITTVNARPSRTPAPANGNGAASHSSSSTCTNEQATPYDEIAVARAHIRNDYPPGCVIFARHVPADTNKTALRAQFSALLDATTALDYVDYTKGLDTCYLRLTTPQHALSLLNRFGGAESARVADGEEEEEGIVLELLDGRREEMYWSCVPDKVRALAVQRARAHHTLERGDGDDEDASMAGPGERKRRKRRR